MVEMRRGQRFCRHILPWQVLTWWVNTLFDILYLDIHVHPGLFVLFCSNFGVCPASSCLESMIVGQSRRRRHVGSTSYPYENIQDVLYGMKAAFRWSLALRNFQPYGTFRGIHDSIFRGHALHHSTTKSSSHKYPDVPGHSSSGSG